MSTSSVRRGEPWTYAAKPPMTTQVTPCRTSTSRVSAGRNSGADISSQGGQSTHDCGQSLHPLIRGRPHRRFRLHDVGVVVRRQLHNKLETAQTEQPFHLLEGRGGAAGLEPR